MKIVKQLSFRPPLPTVLNNADDQRREREVKRMDDVLRLSGIQQPFVEASVRKWLKERDPSEVSAQALHAQTERSQRAPRCTGPLSYLNLSCREMSLRLAEGPLTQWFCGLDRIDEIKAPSQSELARFPQMVDAPRLGALNHALLKEGAQPAPQGAPQALGLKTEIDLKEVGLDSTAIQAPIPSPVDWVWLRDATRTLRKAVGLIRQHGLKHRREEPALFLARRNTLCIEMGATRPRKESQRPRKRVFGLMKKLMKQIKAHAARHQDLLRAHWARTDGSQAQAQRVIERIQGVLDQLPQAIDPAQARIIRGQTPKSSETILSLSEKKVHVIVRGQPEAEVEFGARPLLGEPSEGLILDWQRPQESAPNDARQLQPSVSRLQAAYGAGVLQALFADRPFESRANGDWLKEQEIDNGLCPRSPKELAAKKEEPQFRRAQRRRAQSEGRIALLKNEFLSRPLCRRGFANRQRQIGGSVLAHTLWVFSRWEAAQQRPEALPQAA